MTWIDESISQTAFDFYKHFHLSHGVGFLDCLIAATAHSHGYRLATLNLRHFTVLSGLQDGLPIKRSVRCPRPSARSPRPPTRHPAANFRLIAKRDRSMTCPVALPD